MPPSGAGHGGDGTTVLDQEFGATMLSALRAAVLECASAAGLADDRAIDVMLALHELAANVVRHGSGRGRLRIDVTAGALHCQVSDAGLAGAAARSGPGGSTEGVPGPGAAAAGLAAPGGPARPAPDWPVQHGHGLWLVRRTADLVQVSTGAAGTVVSVTFTLPGG